MSRNIFFILIFSTYLFSNISLNGQVRPRNTIDSIQARYNGKWYDAHTHQYEQQFPKLNNIPPLSNKMNSETLLSYIFLDSLTKYANSDYIYQNYLNRWVENSTKNDTTINAIKYQYNIVDDDPIRYHQYLRNINKEYENSVSNIKYLVYKLFNSLLGDKNSIGPTALRYKAYSDMYNADYILKIQVNSIDSIPKIGYPRTNGIIPNEYTYQINATVMDTLKGKVFQNCYQPPMLKQSDKIQTSNSEICFTYGTGRYRNDFSNFNLDPNLINYVGNFSLNIGQEVIVFLQFTNYLWDFNYDYFQLHLSTAYPIIQNEVKDISKVWSQDTSLSYQNWKLKFEEKKNNILTGGY